MFEQALIAVVIFENICFKTKFIHANNNTQRDYFNSVINNFIKIHQVAVLFVEYFARFKMFTYLYERISTYRAIYINTIYRVSSLSERQREYLGQCKKTKLCRILYLQDDGKSY